MEYVREQTQIGKYIGNYICEITEFGREVVSASAHAHAFVNH